MPLIDTPILVGICLFILVGLLGVVSLIGNADSSTRSVKNPKK